MAKSKIIVLNNEVLTYKYIHISNQIHYSYMNKIHEFSVLFRHHYKRILYKLNH